MLSTYLNFKIVASDLNKSLARLKSETPVALNLPASMSNSDIDTQARMIDGKLKIADLKSPDKLEKFLQRFATLYDLANDTSSSQVASLFMQSREGLSADMIMSLQKLRR